MKRVLILFLLLSFLYSLNMEEESIKVDNENKKYIALTFDDGPSKKYTPMLLKGLKERNVKATFFILGIQASKYPEIVKLIQMDGHVIGNHTYHHYNLSRLNENKYQQEIVDTSNLLFSITSREVKYFRPSYGSIRKNQIKKTNLQLVRWTVDSKDWRYQNTNRIVKKVLNDCDDNEIILMHDIYKTSVDAALIIIDKLQMQGYTFVDLDTFYNKIK